MNGRVTLTMDVALNVFYLAVDRVEAAGQVPASNQVEALLNLADKLDRQFRRQMRLDRGLEPHHPMSYDGHRADVEEALRATNRPEEENP